MISFILKGRAAWRRRQTSGLGPGFKEPLAWDTGEAFVGLQLGSHSFSEKAGCPGGLPYFLSFFSGKH
jgi:hypothetical protein